MSANVFTFPGRAKGLTPWTNDELAELYRVVDLLGRAGLSVVTDMGMSDEGDPWFVFCRSDNDEVIAHFARIDGIFVAASIAVDETFRGANFRQIVDRMVASQPLVVPPPGPGSRLFLHPAVLLTAFVATALAHSEKAMAQDWLKSVEAQWEHGKESTAHALKQVKISWADTLNTVLKSPGHEAKIAYDTAKEGLSLTWASLIAIALTALQPISEKITFIAQLIEDLPIHVADSAHQAVEHAAALTFDASALATAENSDQPAHGHSDAVAHANAELPMPHKAAALDASSSEGVKQTVDAAHIEAPVVQKAMAEDTVAPHLTIDTQFDSGLPGLTIQKVVAAVQAETIVVHVDAGTFSSATIDLQDLTTDAIHLLNIRNDNQTGDSGKSDSSGSSSHGSGDTGGGSPSHAQTSPLTNNNQAATTTPSTGDSAAVITPSTGSSDQSGNGVITFVGGNEIVDGTRTDGGTKQALVTDFVTSGTHGIAQQVAITNPIAQQELNGILSVYGSVTVVFFDSSTPSKDVILYSPGVVWIDVKDVAGGHVSNSGGNLIIDNGPTLGALTLLGVATASHFDSV